MRRSELDTDTRHVQASPSDPSSFHSEEEQAWSSRRAAGLKRWVLSGRSELLILLVLFAALAVVQLRAFHYPLLGAHAFRQTQTAYQALGFHENGVSLLHPKLPVFGEPFEVPFEFPLFQAGGAALMSWGLSADVAMRTMAFLSFLLSAVLLWGLVRHIAGAAAGVAAVAFYLFSPFALLWSKASLIEYLAVSGALAWLWGTLLWIQKRRLGFLALAAFGGLVAMLVKPTTGLFWALPIVGALSTGTKARLQMIRQTAVWVVVLAVPFGAALVWTLHADGVKAAHEATAWLTSGRLRSWNLGTVQQRLVLENWSVVGSRIQGYITGFPPLLLLFVPLMLRRRTHFRTVWVLLMVVPVVTIGTFWNLYVVHDYYLAAVTPIGAAALGLAFGRAWDSAVRRRVQLLVVAAAGTGIASLLVASAPYWRAGFSEYPGNDLSVAEELQRLTRPSDLIMFEGYDWSPHIAYYARRGGFMLRDTPSPGEAAVADRLSETGYRFLLTAKLESSRAVEFLNSREWTGVLGKWTYVTADSPDELDGAKAGATSKDLAAGGALILATPTSVPCTDRGQPLPRGEGVTALHLAVGTSPTAKVQVSPSLGFLPNREWIFVNPGLDTGPLLVSCRDAEQVTVDRIYSRVRL